VRQFILIFYNLSIHIYGCLKILLFETLTLLLTLFKDFVI